MRNQFWGERERERDCEKFVEEILKRFALREKLSFMICVRLIFKAKKKEEKIILIGLQSSTRATSSHRIYKQHINSTLIMPFLSPHTKIFFHKFYIGKKNLLNLNVFFQQKFSFAVSAVLCVCVASLQLANLSTFPLFLS